ncbi:MAG: hypothetical protein A2Y63_02040 [Candidatus Riflebacteria bacterium RBG_13_59_9]|nr:MAG: hypothetical protein A2Y63_02040 [Candidatus Riflebacteria bacterium RBG_13_59_9]
MTTRASSVWDFFLGFSVGLLFMGTASALLAELKHLVELGRTGKVFEILPTFDEALGGDGFEVGNEKMLDEMISRSQHDDEHVRARRKYREQGTAGHGGGDQAVYYDEE